MEKSKKENIFYFNLIIRYTILLFIGLLGIHFIYLILTPLTIYPVYFILKLFYNITIQNSSIFILNYQIEIVEACVAGAAYYLLLILNISVSMNIKQRIYSLFYSLFVLLAINIIRIVILSFLLVNNFLFFDFTHMLFWYGLSTIFVVAIWFSEVKIFKIKNIPIYSDIINLMKIIK
jgi:exosortase/archaeosortase family protein